MNKYILLLIIPFLSFGQDDYVAQSQRNSEKTIPSQSNDCNSLTNFGDIKICFPNILGMTECYSDPLVKYASDMFKGSNQEIILGFYLTDDIYKSRYNDFFENGVGDEYIKIYSMESIKGVPADESTIELLSSNIKPMFDNYNETLKTMIDSRSNNLPIDVSFDRPILLEEYQISPKIKSFVLLTSFDVEDENYIQTAVINIILIKNRIVFYAYYDVYNGLSNINKTKSSNDYFGLRLLQHN